MNSFISAFFLLLIAASSALFAQAGPPREALVIGVGDYGGASYKGRAIPNLPGITTADLPNIQQKLKSLGFHVTVAENPTLAEAKKAVDAFSARIKAAPGVSLFYFSGHGGEHEGKNYLITRGAKIGSSADLADEALNAQRVINGMEESGGPVNIVFLDCCREDLGKSIGGADMAPLKAKGSFIGFATRSGDFADSGTEGSPFTRFLLKNIDKPGVSVSDMYASVIADVKDYTKRMLGEERRPGYYSELDAPFYFVPAGISKTEPAMPSVPGKASPPPDTPLGTLVSELARENSGERITVAVGNFSYANTSLLSPFSSVLRDQMEKALAESRKFKVLTRHELTALQMQGKFQGKGILEPGKSQVRASIEGVTGIVRGTFQTNADQITICVELAPVAGGEIRKTQLSVPLSQINSISPELRIASGMVVEDLIKPQNIDRSLANLKETILQPTTKLPQDFQAEIFTSDGRRAYAEKENVTFGVRCAKECHIAVICHQSDGTSVILFPNRWNSNTLIPANKSIDIPGTNKSGFEIEIGAPFGSDVVELVACSQPSELHKTLSSFASNNDRPFQVMTRGMAVKGIQNSMASAPAGSPEPLRWGHDSIIISTFPKK